jgi:general secretion pathway protein I
MLNSAYNQTPTSGDARERGQQKGFTLLEVVVATAIAGLALVGLFKAGTAGVFAGNTASRVEEAIERAQSHLAAFGREGAVVASELEGEDGGGYRWRLRAIPLVAEQPAATGNATFISLFDIQVIIAWRAWGQDRSVLLTTRRIGTITPQTR